MLGYTWFEIWVILGVTLLVASLIGSPGKRRPRRLPDPPPGDDAG